MAKVTEYPRITKMKDNDILLVDGPDGTRTILQTDASKQMGGEVIMVNESAGDSTKVVINTTDEDIELATMADLEPVEEDVDELKTHTSMLMDASSGKLFNVVLGDSPAYIQNVPDDALNYATIEFLGGRTVLSGYNMIPSAVSTIVSKDQYDETVDTFTVDPEIIAKCDGYGEGTNGFYNELNFTDKKYHKRVKTIALSDLQWSYMYGRFMATTTDRKYSADIICSKYTPTTEKGIDKTIYSLDSHYGIKRLVIWDSDYTDIERFRASLPGLYICYPLETEVEVDINELSYSPTITLDGGTVTLNNANDGAVPVGIEYYIKTAGSSVGESLYTLDVFEGETLEDKLYNAFDTVERGIILCGEINITKPYTAKAKNYGYITLVGATMYFGSFSGAWFDQSESLFNKVPQFSNCFLYGHGNTLFSASANMVKPKFTDCTLYNVAVAKSASRYVQSLYLLNCDIEGTDILAQASTFYDLKVIGCRIEKSASYSNPSTDDTLFIAGMIEQGTISSSLVESRNHEIVRTGAAKNLVIENNYFEVLNGGLLVQNGANEDCVVTVHGNSFIGTYDVQYMVSIASSKYSGLSVYDNYVGTITGVFCNVSKCYITSTDNVRRELVFAQGGNVQWVEI